MKLKVKFEVVNGKVMMDEKDFMDVLGDLVLLKHLQNLGVNNWRNYENPGIFPEDYNTLEELIGDIEKF